MSLNDIVFDEPGVVANQDNPAGEAFGFDYAESGDDVWTFYGPGPAKHLLEVDQAIEHPETASMEIVSNGVTYIVRPVRFEDGLWLSKYKIGLPAEALFGLVVAYPEGESMFNEDERLIVRYAEGVDHVLELLYLNPLGVWSRQYGTFVRVSDSLAGMDDYATMEIDTDRAEEYLDLFDRKYPTVEETRAFATDVPAEEPESEDEPENIEE